MYKSLKQAYQETPGEFKLAVITLVATLALFYIAMNLFA